MICSRYLLIGKRYIETIIISRPRLSRPYIVYPPVLLLTLTGHTSCPHRCLALSGDPALDSFRPLEGSIKQAGDGAQRQTCPRYQ